MSNSTPTARVTARDLSSKLETAHIVLTPQAATQDPAAFLRAHLADDGLAVIERTDEVSIVELKHLTIDAKTIAIHAFSASRKAQVRLARADSTWRGDAVRECAQGDTGSIAVQAQRRTHMCLGTRVASTSNSITLAEARIKPYTLPIAPSTSDQHDIAHINYFEQTTSGRLVCIAHRVTGIVAREGK